MKKSILLLAAIFVAVVIQAQSLEEIVKNYTIANKLDKISGISTVKITARMSAMGMDMPMELWMKNPDKLRSVVNFNGQESITVIDGMKGYTINPMSASSGPIELPADKLEQQKNKLVFNNYMAQYLEKGKLTLLGIENVGDKPAFKIKIDMEGGTMIVFIDKSSYLITKGSMTTSNQGTEVTADMLFSDFKNNNGVFLPMKQTISANGMAFTMVYDKVEVNIPMEDSLFKLK